MTAGVGALPVSRLHNIVRLWALQHLRPAGRALAVAKGSSARIPLYLWQVLGEGWCIHSEHPITGDIRLVELTGEDLTWPQARAWFNSHTGSPVSPVDAVPRQTLAEETVVHLLRESGSLDIGYADSVVQAMDFDDIFFRVSQGLRPYTSRMESFEQAAADEVLGRVQALSQPQKNAFLSPDGFALLVGQLAGPLQEGVDDALAELAQMRNARVLSARLPAEFQLFVTEQLERALASGVRAPVRYPLEEFFSSLVPDECLDALRPARQ